jgi:CDP-6-deoxy-D-xylo-4-hexulose-3-dehydrase
MGAAFGIVQLDKLARNIDMRTSNYTRMREFFSQYEEFFILPKQLPESRTGWLAFATTLRTTAPFVRRDMQIFLEKRNIQTRTVFTGNILRQPGFKNQPHKAAAEGYPEADKVMRGGMLLACHHGLNDAQIAHVMESVTEFMKQV